MCTFCTEHGLDDKWYFNFANYLFSKIYPTPELQEEAKKAWTSETGRLRTVDHYGDPEHTHRPPDEYTSGVGGAFAQIIAQPEAMKVMEIADEACKREDTFMVLSRCNCALAYRGKMEYRCIVFGVPVTLSAKTGYQRYPKEGLTEFGGAEWRELRKILYDGRKVSLTVPDAKELIAEWNKRGFYSTLVTRATFPLIDGICFCEAPYCQRYRRRRERGLSNPDLGLRKGHYIARIDPQKCNSCGACMMRCMFGAILVSHHNKLALVDPKDCFGCGLCQIECKRDAVTMVPRVEVSAAKNLW